MATFWLNSNGSNTAPFDTKAKGATTFESLRSQTIATTDTIMVARGSVTNDPAFNGATFGKVCSIIAEDDGVNDESTRPVINYTVATDGPFFGGSNVGNDINITGIKFTSNNAAAPDWYTTFSGSYKFVMTDCIISKIVSTGGSPMFQNTSVYSINRCVLKSNMTASNMILMESGKSLKSSTIISNAISTTPIQGGSGGEIVDTVIYLTNSGFAENLAINATNATLTNCIWYGVGVKPITFADGTNTITNAMNVDPKVNTTTFRYESDSPALGAGTLLTNIGWDQLTQKAQSVVRFSTGSSSYSGGEFFPPFTGGLGHVPHAF